MLIQQYAFLLKYHHLVTNVAGKTFITPEDATYASSNSDVDSSYALSASKPIQAGDELFLPFSQHPKSHLGAESLLFHNIPTTEDFDMAEQIIQDEIEKLRHKRRGREFKLDKDIGTMQHGKE